MSQLAEIALSRAIAFVATVVLVLCCGTGATAGAPTRVLAGSSATVSLEAGDVVASPLAPTGASVPGGASRLIPWLANWPPVSCPSGVCAVAACRPYRVDQRQS